MISLKKVKLKDELPENLLRDKKVRALAESLDESLNRAISVIEKINFYSNLENLDEDVLDHLLWENHMGEYEGIMLARNKRDKANLVSNAVELHRTKGTPHAVELALKSVGIECDLVEWFEYGGAPYTFKITVISELSNSINFKAAPGVIKAFKNTRSWLEKIEYISRGVMKNLEKHNLATTHRVFNYFGRRPPVLDAQYWNLDGAISLDNDWDPIKLSVLSRLNLSNSNKTEARIRLENKLKHLESFESKSLLRIKSNFWYRKGIFLDGTWLVDGENEFGSLELNEKKDVVLNIKEKMNLKITTSTKNSSELTIKKNWWQLEGVVSLGDGRLLNAETRKEVI